MRGILVKTGENATWRHSCACQGEQEKHNRNE